MGAYTRYLKMIPFFTELVETELCKIASISIERKYKKGMLIFMENEPGDAVYFVKNGRVKLSKMHSDGREQILQLLQEGDIFAEVVLFDQGPYPATAEAIEDSTIGIIRSKDMEELLRQNPEITIKILKVMSRRLRNAQTLVRDLALKDTYSRTASTLLRLARDHGQKIEKGMLLNLPLTRQELASLVGTSRETVTRILGDFKKDKAVFMEQQDLIINPEKLLTWLER